MTLGPGEGQEDEEGQSSRESQAVKCEHGRTRWIGSEVCGDLGLHERHPSRAAGGEWKDGPRVAR